MSHSTTTGSGEECRSAKSQTPPKPPHDPKRHSLTRHRVVQLKGQHADHVARGLRVRRGRSFLFLTFIAARFARASCRIRPGAIGVTDLPGKFNIASSP